MDGDTFGGDAGGDNGKDHLWRYYEPTGVTWNGCLAIGKPATEEVVKVGDTYQYKIKVYNAGDNDFTNVRGQGHAAQRRHLHQRRAGAQNSAPPTRWCGTSAPCCPARSSRPPSP